MRTSPSETNCVLPAKNKEIVSNLENVQPSEHCDMQLVILNETDFEDWFSNCDLSDSVLNQLADSVNLDEISVHLPLEGDFMELICRNREERLAEVIKGTEAIPNKDTEAICNKDTAEVIGTVELSHQPAVVDSSAKHDTDVVHTGE
jgi:hypothetical protein